MNTPRIAVLVAAAALCAGSAVAKLPPLNDEAEAKAAEAAAKTAHGNKVANYQLCKSMDATAGSYFAKAKKEGKVVKPADKADACADPGPFVYAPPAAPAPALEAAGAHSPPRTAVAPPSSLTPQAAQAPAKK